MSHERNLRYLNTNRIVYRRLPTTDKPTEETDVYMFYQNGTHECYELFRSTAKITTYKSLKWHLLVLWYLNPQLDQDEFLRLAQVIVHKPNGFVTFNVGEKLLDKIVYEVSMLDLDEPPKNRLRKVIFKPFTRTSKEDKLRIVGRLIGRSVKICADDIYECMIDLNDMGKKITIGRIAGLLDCSSRTVHRNMCVQLKREKELLNKQL
jgi:cytochrome P450